MHNGLTFIVCTRDNYKEFVLTIESILPHLLEADEILVIDGSTNIDDKYAIEIEKIRARVKPLKYLIRTPKGIYNALNVALDNVINEWVSIIHSGDTVIAESLGLIRTIMRENDAQVIICDQRYGPDYASSSILRSKKHREIFPHQSMIYKRELHNEYGLYDETKIAGADQIFFNSLPSSEKIVYVPLIYSFFNTNGISSVFSWELMLEDIGLKSSKAKKIQSFFKHILKLVAGLFGAKFTHRLRVFKNFMHENKK